MAILYLRHDIYKEAFCIHTFICTNENFFESHVKCSNKNLEDAAKG